MVKSSLTYALAFQSFQPENYAAQQRVHGPLPPQHFVSRRRSSGRALAPWGTCASTATIATAATTTTTTTRTRRTTTKWPFLGWTRDRHPNKCTRSFNSMARQSEYVNEGEEDDKMNPEDNAVDANTNETTGGASDAAAATAAAAGVLDEKDTTHQRRQRRETEIDFLRKELDHVEGLQEIVDELVSLAEWDVDFASNYDEEEEEEEEEDFSDNDQEEDDDDDDIIIWSEEALSDIFAEIADDENYEDLDEDMELDEYDLIMKEEDDEEDYEDDDDDDDVTEEDLDHELDQVRSAFDLQRMEERIRLSAAADLERALQQGVVPASAGVGNECLPGDYGFDPFNLAEKDYFRQTQGFLLKLLPGGEASSAPMSSPTRRPKALILRDLREAEIRHGRLAMLAAVFWPLQEMLDRLLLDTDQAGPLLYGPVTLPYFPLIMTAIMLLLGYLDVYAQAVKDMEFMGEAYLPGDCFWDPLRILQGAPDSMKRNMQERELFNGRVAMLAFAAFVWEEAVTHLPLIEIGENDLLLEPAYEVPFIQQWLDAQFSPTDPEVGFLTPSQMDSPQTLLKALLDKAGEETDN